MDDRDTANTAIDWILEEIEEYGTAQSDQDRDDALFDIAGIVLAAIAAIPSDRRSHSFLAFQHSQRLRARPEQTFDDAIRRVVHASESERMLMLHMLAQRFALLQAERKKP
jgi:hypothetical protein